MEEENLKWVMILLVLVLVAIVADVSVRLSPAAKSKPQSRCLAIPTKFIMENPDCTNKLIEAANLTNIRVVPPGTLELRQFKQSNFANRNLLEK